MLSLSYFELWQHRTLQQLTRSIPDCHGETNRQPVLDSRFNAGAPRYTSGYH